MTRIKGLASVMVFAVATVAVASMGAGDGRDDENFTRVETFGDNAANGNNDVQWVKVLIDGRTREVFAFQPQIVPANRTAVPAP